MSHPEFDSPRYLGGTKSGQHRKSPQATYGYTTQTSNSTNAGIGAISYNPALLAAWAGKSLLTEHPVENAGIRAGEIVGYRCWCLQAEDMSLGSTAVVYTWRPKAIEQCKESIRSSQYGAGLHAFKAPSLLYMNYVLLATNGIMVFGSVYLWGAVLEHEHGYRAEYASVRSLDRIHGMGADYPDMLRTMQYKYGVGGEDKA